MHNMLMYANLYADMISWYTSGARHEINNTTDQSINKKDSTGNNILYLINNIEIVSSKSTILTKMLSIDR